MDIKPVMFEMEGPVGTLELRKYESESKSSEPVVVVPNGYGLLAYSDALCRRLATIGRPTFAANLRGQGGSGGSLSVHGCSDDLREVLTRVGPESPSGRVVLYVHCSAMLYVLRWSREDDVWSRVSGIILYSYLAEPVKHLERFREKAKTYGVRLAANLGDVASSPEAYASVPVPLSVVHPMSGLSLLRASNQEVEELREVAVPIRVLKPTHGYELEDSPQPEVVEQTVQSSIGPLLATF